MTAKFLTLSAIPVWFVSPWREGCVWVGLTVENLVLSHAVGVPIPPEADDDEPVFLGHDRLVDVPAGLQMW